MMKTTPPAPVVMRPGRTNLSYFAFGSACMALFALLTQLGGDTSRNLSLLNTMNMGVIKKTNTMQQLAGGDGGLYDDDEDDDVLSSSSLSLYSTSDDTKTKKNSTKPTLLLHLGPPKTSTSYLQCILTDMIDTLALDNYVYLGMHVWQCRKNGSPNQGAFNLKIDFPFEQPEMPKTTSFSKVAAFSPTFLKELREAHSQGKNAIIMNEGFKHFTTKQRKLVMDEFSSNWNVKLILNYRRLYELLPSGYNQMHKPNKFANYYQSLTLWPGETNKDGVVGKPLLPFDLDENYNTTKGPGVEEVKQLYEAFDDVTIINLHEMDHSMSGDAVLQEMFCHIVGDDSMPCSCAAVQLDETVKIGEKAANPFYSFNYDMLATAAYEKQLFGFQKKSAEEQPFLPTHGRRVIVNQVQRYHEDTLNLTLNDFDTFCMAKEKMDLLLNASISAEKVIYGSKWTSQHEVNLRQAFLAYQQKRPYLFCWINTEKTLQDPKWLAFFDSI